MNTPSLMKIWLLAHCISLALLGTCSAATPVNGNVSGAWTSQGSQTDLVVNGTSVSISEGEYRTVVVKNGGRLSVSGLLTANEILLATGGALNVSGELHSPRVSVDGTLNVRSNLNATELSVINGTAQLLGISNRVDSLLVRGTLVTLGQWWATEVTIPTNGIVKVYPREAGISLSGALFLSCLNLYIHDGGLIDGRGAGSDPRGQGHDWYANATGGGHGGMGGRGYWNSSGGGNEGQAFGSAITYESFMGGAGGLMGGAGIFLEAEQEMTIDGVINADGVTSTAPGSGGGAGGGILLRSARINITGSLLARGGDGGANSGGGGGGRIKVFYGNDDMPDFSARVSVAGGKAGGYLNTQPGQPGSVHRDHIPRIQSIVSPADHESVTNGHLRFRFSITDLSESIDRHKDSLSPRIELSKDGFKTIDYAFDQEESLVGWSAILYYSRDTVEYIPQVHIESGEYAWRASLRDQSLSTRYTTPRKMFVDSNTSAGPVLTMRQTPAILITGAELGSAYEIIFTEALVPNGDWRTLMSVSITTNPQIVYDESAFGKPTRFYQLRKIQ